MKILVTGGIGFIGSNLCDFLVKNDHRVIVVDDLSTGYELNISSVRASIDFFKEKIECFDFESVVDVDVIVHLAAQPSVPTSIANFGDSSSSNMLGTIKVIDYCRKNHIPLVYASSSAIYGDLGLGNDTSLQVDLLSPYAVDKYAMEMYAKIAYKLYKLSSIGLRFFNVYGPRQDPSSAYSGVISVFIDRLLQGNDITINGGHQTRDFIYVADVVDAIYKSIIVSSSSIVCEQTNVLTGSSISIDKLAIILMKEVEIDVEKNYRDLPLGDPEQSNGTVEKMTKLLNINLQAMTTIQNGLSRTVAYIRNQ